MSRIEIAIDRVYLIKKLIRQAKEKQKYDPKPELYQHQIKKLELYLIDAQKELNEAKKECKRLFDISNRIK